MTPAFPYRYAEGDVTTALSLLSGMIAHAVIMLH